MKSARTKISRTFLALSLCLLVPIAGCNQYANAQNTVSVIGQIISLAQSDLPALQSSGVFTASESQTVADYLTGLSGLDSQAGTCLTSIGSSGKSAALLACFNAFAAGIVSPAELALLRILSPKAQAQVQLWITAVTLAVNAGIALFGGTSVAAPQIAARPASRADLDALRARIDFSIYGE